MGKFRGRGMKQQPMLTKNQLVDTYEKRFKVLGDAVQDLQNLLIQQLGRMNVDLSMLKKQMEVVDYRSVATRDLAISGKLFTDEGHNDRARELRVLDFEEQSSADDIKRKLQPASGPVKLGQWATLTVTAQYPETLEVPTIKGKTGVEMTNADGNKDTISTMETRPHPNAGEKIEELSSLRSKIQVGAGSLMPELELEVVGMNIKDVKDISLKIPPRYGQFAGKDVTFKVELLDLKEEAPKPKQEEVTDGKAAQPTEAVVER